MAAFRELSPSPLRVMLLRETHAARNNLRERQDRHPLVIPLGTGVCRVGVVEVGTWIERTEEHDRDHRVGCSGAEGGPVRLRRADGAVPADGLRAGSGPAAEPG